MNAAFPAGAFAKQDDGADSEFYRAPRLVTHIDADAVTALARYYGQILRDGDIVLDLMSSWVSHLPARLRPGAVIGHGMNATELAANPALTKWLVQDLNRDQVLPLEDESVDAALCCVGVQYLQQPVAVFADVRRVLRPGAPFAVSYSNRCFATKAVAIWRALPSEHQARLISAYFELAGFASSERYVLTDGRDGDPLTVVTGRA